MNKTSKTLATIGLVIVFFLLSGAIQAAAESSGNPHGLGIFSLILLLALIAGIRAVWKSEPPVSDNHNLDKTDKNV